MSRWEPPLDEYERLERNDTTPKEYINAIDIFHRQHNHQSPNAKDIITRRHPDNPSVKETAVKIYRYETWDSLWREFQKVNPGIAEKIAVRDKPNKCPSLLINYAPWEMCKGKDSSCLCLNCEGTNTTIGYHNTKYDN
jgi:hypothetical protein